MACACKKNKTNTEDITVEPVVAQESNKTTTKVTTRTLAKPDDITIEPISPVDNNSAIKTTKIIQNKSTADLLQDAREINLEQCYLCAKKHIERAKDFFEEYHTGYPDHVKNLIESVQIAERDVMRAFLLWQRIMGQMNMGEGELLGKNANQLKMKSAHITLANKIRDERLHLSDDPLYVPNFDDLLVEIHLLQHKVMDNV